MQSERGGSLDTREAILKAAQKLFARFGFNKTTVDEIAAAAHTAKSTLYYHFSSKEDVFRAVIEREGRVLAEGISEAMEAAPSPEGKLRAYVLTRMRHLRDLANFYNALTEEYLEHYSFIEKVREKDFRSEMKVIGDVLSEGHRQGMFRVQGGDIALTARAVITALKGLEYPWAVSTEVTSIEADAEVLLGVLFHGIVADPK